MKTFGQIIRTKRESLGLLLRQVASYLDIDQSILSKIKRNEGRPNKNNIFKLAEKLKLDKDDFFVKFMSKKIAYEIIDEDFANKVLKVAEQKVKYLNSNLVKK